MISNKKDLPEDASIAISLQGIIKKFPSTPENAPALASISTQIRRGSITGLIGPDGSGKTTLIRIIAGLLLPSDGHVLVEGFDPVKDTDKLRVFLGYMPQKFGLYEDLTVIENLILYADLRGVFCMTLVTEYTTMLDIK